jgi:hypothetical protein
LTIISPDHLAMLAKSGITAEFAIARGYETILDKRRLSELKITAAGRNTPGLLIPLLRVDGSTWGWQYRPDVPRLRTGKTVKYETPTGQSNGLDVPPGVAAMLGDPGVPLWITEGTKKADCGAINGLCIVDLIGVWNWLHTNTAGGKMALPEWRDCALNAGRRVVVAFDGDTARNEKVQAAARGLAGYLATKGARIEYLWLPDTDDKTGLDDYLAEHSVEELLRLIKPTQPRPSERAATPPRTAAYPHSPRSSEPPACAHMRYILDAVAEEVVSRGLVGEQRLAKTLYLALTSRLLDKQVSVGVKGHSASGKSYTVETVARMFPPEAYIEFTAMSERALIYYPEKFAHRTLIIYEVTALREGVEDDMTSYIVRSLLSEGRIVYPVTVRDNDKDGTGFKTITITKEGPTNLLFTTTRTRVHAENETRILSLATDDSRAQTARVLAELADESSHSDDDLERWRDLQLWLAGAEHRVTIPYAKQLVRLIPPVAVRLRRDIGAVLALIRAHAMLHQVNRGRDTSGAIIAALDDYTVVRELVADIIAEGVGQTVSDAVRETAAAVAAIATKEGATVRAIADRLKLDQSNVSRRLRVAADGGYLRNLEDKRGKPGRWVVGDPLPESINLLPDPAQLCDTNATAETALNLGLCGYAPEFEGENGSEETDLPYPPGDGDRVEVDTDTEPDLVGENADPDGGLFEYPAHNGKDVAERCGCGNALMSLEARSRGTCRPCHDKTMAGYDQ